jgi:hypothetical protein
VSADLGCSGSGRLHRSLRGLSRGRLWRRMTMIALRWWWGCSRDWSRVVAPSQKVVVHGFDPGGHVQHLFALSRLRDLVLCQARRRLHSSCRRLQRRRRGTRFCYLAGCCIGYCSRNPAPTCQASTTRKAELGSTLPAR